MDVDWIVQDGENMVKQCTKPHTRTTPRTAIMRMSVEGINAVVAAIQQARPNVFWEIARMAAT